jgi:DNA-directed RNA polymerase subunit RPC12/RpoP
MRSCNSLKGGDILRSADSSRSVDIDSAEIGEKYKCINCSARFSGIGKKIHCPLCESSQIIKDLD